MKLFLSISALFLFVSIEMFAQKVFPYLDNLEYLKSFQNGQSRQVDYLRPVDVSYS
jgi:hypothetical protein